MYKTINEERRRAEQKENYDFMLSVLGDKPKGFRGQSNYQRGFVHALGGLDYNKHRPSLDGHPKSGYGPALYLAGFAEAWGLPFYALYGNGWERDLFIRLVAELDK